MPVAASVALAVACAASSRVQWSAFVGHPLRQLVAELAEVDCCRSFPAALSSLLGAHALTNYIDGNEESFDSRLIPSNMAFAKRAQETVFGPFEQVSMKSIVASLCLVFV
jgi:hypothetical protein